MKKEGVLGSLIWKFSERISAQLISMIVSVILARLLEPENYGLVAIVMIFITLANVFVSDGLGCALIQKKDADELDFFSVLYINIGLSIALYLVLFFFAPFIADFYGAGYELLTPVLRVLGLRIILTSVNSVQHAYISKKMMFRKYFYSTLFGTLVSAIVGIAMAYLNYGVWALVFQYLVSSSVSSIVLIIIFKHKPKFLFSLDRVKKLYPYGMRILATNLMITGYQELRALIIGKVYSSEDLAYFDRGKQFPNLLITNINASISSVLFPVLSSKQDDINKVKELTRKSIRISSYIMCPMMLGMMAVSEPFVKVVLTEKWIACVPLMQLFCSMNLFYPAHTANMQAVKAMGRSDLYFRYELLKKAIELIVLIAVVNVSVKAIVLGMAVCANLFVLVNAYPNKKLINYGFFEQIKDMFPSLSIAIVMFGCVYAVNFIVVNDILKLVIQIVSGVIIYLILSIVTRNQEFYIIKNIVLNLLKKQI